VKLAYNEEDDTHYVSISNTETEVYLPGNRLYENLYLFIYFVF